MTYAPLLISVKEACATLRIGKTNCFALIRTGKLKAVKIGRATRITTESIRALAGEAHGAPQAPAN